MTRLTLQVRGPIARSTWKRFRKRLGEATAAKAVLASGGFVVLVAATTVEPSLSGIWVGSDGSEFRVYHAGTSVKAAFLELGALARRRGGSIGSVPLVGMYANGTVTGTIWIAQDHVASEQCGGLGRPRPYDLELRINDDLDRMEARWRSRSIDFASCTESAPEARSYWLVRKHN